MFEIGNSLREARLRQGLDFSEVERVTKIRPKYLRALEDEQFALLPAQTYVKGFLRTYAEFLGLDGQLYVDEYNSRYVTREEDPPFRPRRTSARTRRTESGVVLGTLIGIAVVFALVIVAWRSGGDTPPRQPAPLADPDLRAPAPTEVIVRAARGTTRLEVREESDSGRARFGGTLEEGRDLRFELETPLWMYVQRPATVDLVIGGQPVRVQWRLIVVDADGGVTRAPSD